jgi:hypothetical protein
MIRRLPVALASLLFACAPSVAAPRKPREAAAPTVVVAEAPPVPSPPRKSLAPLPVHAMSLGDGSESCAIVASVLAVSSPPLAVPGGRAPASVLAVSSPPLAVASVPGSAGDARVVCWGGRPRPATAWNTTGPLPPRAPHEIALPFASPPIAVTVGRSHRCALLENGKVACWTELAPVAELVPFPQGSSVVSISAGDEFTCALLVGGAVTCWGANDEGQLGLGNTVATTRPSQNVPLGGPAVALGSGLGSSCAIVDRTGGRAVVCWGRNGNGALGLGDARNRGDAPVPKTGLAAVDLGPMGPGAQPIAVTVAGHACVLFEDGAVKCWGWNRFGQLGLGDGKNRGDAPKQLGAALPAVPLGGKAVAIAAAITHSCAILADGAVKCWGWNREGALGLGDTAPRGFSKFGRPAPVELTAVDLGGPAIAVAVGTERSCALLDSNVLKCWGANRDGELGLGDTENRGDKPGQMGTALPAVDLGSSQ